MKKQRNRIITLKNSKYQPSKAELEKKIRINATPEQLAKAVVQEVEIKHED